MAGNITDLINENLTVIKSAKLTQMNASTTDVSTWLSNLVMMDIGQTSKDLLVFIHDLSVADIDDELRLEILELARNQLRTICESMRKHYFTPKPKLTKIDEQIFELSLEFRVLQAMIYFSLAQRLTLKLSSIKSGLLGLNKKRALSSKIGQCIHRSINEFFNIQYELSALYKPMLKGFWIRVHYLYKLARQLNLNQEAFFNNQLIFARKSTIDHMYLRTIILSVADTNKIRQNEIFKLYHLSEDWADYVEIAEKSTGQDLFVVDPNIDEEPKYITKSTNLNHKVLYINSQRLMQYFSESTPVTKERLAQHQLQISHILHKHLKDVFSAPLERMAIRHDVQGQKVELVFGLAACHFHLNNMQPMQEISAINHAALSTSLDLGVDMIYNADQPDKSNINMPDLSPVYSCKIINTSAGGYCLQWDESTAIPSLKSGEIIIYREKNDPWSVGMIRWIKHINHYTTEFGVQFVSLESQACVVKQYTRQLDVQHKSMRGIILTDVANNINLPTIILPPMSFKMNTKISVSLPDNEMIFTLGECILETNGFMQFYFTMQTDQGSTVVSSAKVPEKNTALNEIWKVL